jgi:hypothetical protein
MQAIFKSLCFLTLFSSCLSLPLTAKRPFKNQLISLQSAEIKVDNAAPRYVIHAVKDLRGQIHSAEHSEMKQVPVVDIQISEEGTEGLGEEGYQLKVTEQYVSVKGLTWRGAHYGILELIKLLAESSNGVSLPAAFTERESPSFDLRAMYAHTAWVYNYPFALRKWTLEDWKRYVDLLAYMKVNVLQIWNLVSIMPQPLSPGDRSYLEMFPEVIRYAKEERGFRAVWVGDAANNVALPTTTPFINREYYIVHSLRDPSDWSQMQDIIASRAALYRSIPNADGYWIIDSDPGGWPGSPSQDFVKVLLENWKLINQTKRNNNPELIYWIWHGWGNKTKSEDLTSVLQSLQNRVGTKLSLLACFPDDLDIISRLNLINKTTWFPYGAIEGEPSSPYTSFRIQQIQKAFEVANSNGQVRGVMGNAQTPLVQIPNLWLFQQKAWNSNYNPQSHLAMLEGVARGVYPNIAKDLAHGWQLLTENNAGEARAMADRLEMALRGNHLGPAGTIGRYVIPSGKWLVENLVMQLRLHAEAVDFTFKLKDPSTFEPIRSSAEQYLKSSMAGVKATGFRPALNKEGNNLLPFFNWFYPTEDYGKIRSSWKEFKEQRPRDAEQIYAHLKGKYAGEHSEAVSREMVEFLVGEPPKRAPNFKYAN